MAEGEADSVLQPNTGKRVGNDVGDKVVHLIDAPSSRFEVPGPPSVFFDAVAMILAPEAAQKLSRNPAALGFVMDAYAHLRAIGHCEGSKVILDGVGIAPDEGVGPHENLAEMARRRYRAREARVRDLAQSNRKT